MYMYNTIFRHMSLTKTAQRRIQKDIQELTKNPLHSSGIYIQHNENDITKATALLFGPEKTPYDFGYYLFKFDFPGNYPFEPPAVKFMTQDPQGHTRFHPNLYTQGKVCLSIINTWQGPSWTSVQTFSSVLLSVKSIMDESPLANEPGFEHAEATKHTNFNGCIEYENVRVAILYNLKNISAQFEHFRPVMEKHYVDNFQKIKEHVKRLKEKNQGKEFHCSVYNMTVKCDYENLLSELDSLYDKLLPKYPPPVDRTQEEKTTDTQTPQTGIDEEPKVEAKPESPKKLKIKKLDVKPCVVEQPTQTEPNNENDSVGTKVDAETPQTQKKAKIMLVKKK